MAANQSLQKMLSTAGKFVEARNGCWNHEEWESLVGQVAEMGFSLDDEGKRNLGNILEALKFFYGNLPPQAPRKRAPAPPKPKAKA